MSQEREVITTTGAGINAKDALEAQEPEDAVELRKQKKAKFARILERGFTHGRLDVKLPDTVYGEWILNDPLSILEAQSLGFVVDTEFAPKQPHLRHNQSDGTAVVGDVIHMIMPVEDKLLIEEVKQEMREAAHGKPGQSGPQQEEREFTGPTQTKLGMPVVQESKDRIARKAELEETLRRIDAKNKAGVESVQTSVPRVQEIIR